eukprot:COSAG01_NODE_2589_length_7411_cov_50.806482_6_plen_106_part_00
MAAFMTAAQSKLAQDSGEYEELMKRAAESVATPGTSAGDLLTAFAGKMQHTIATMAAKRHEQLQKVAMLVQTGQLPVQQLPLLLPQLGVAPSEVRRPLRPFWRLF